MALNHYDINDNVELIALLTLGSSGAGFDPTNVQCKVLDPTGAVTTYVYGVDPEITHSVEMGEYSLIIEVLSAGVHGYRWEAEDTGTDSRSGSGEGQFYARRSMFVGAAAGAVSGGGIDGGSP